MENKKEFNISQIAMEVRQLNDRDFFRYQSNINNSILALFSAKKSKLISEDEFKKSKEELFLIRTMMEDLRDPYVSTKEFDAKYLGVDEEVEEVQQDDEDEKMHNIMEVVKNLMGLKEEVIDQMYEDIKSQLRPEGFYKLYLESFLMTTHDFIDNLLDSKPSHNILIEINEFLDCMEYIKKEIKEYDNIKKEE